MLNPVTGVLQEFRHLIKGTDKKIWTKYLANKFGRLAQGVSKSIEGTNTMYFIPKEEVPFKTKKVTYPKIVCNIRLSKAGADVADNFGICDFLGFEGYFFFWDVIHGVGSLYSLAHSLG